MNQMHPTPLVTTTDTDNVRTLNLGAAPAHPLSCAMIHAISDALDAAAHDATTNVVILYGAGNIFCAGHDLKEIARNRTALDHGAAFLTGLFTDCADMMQKLANFPKPTIAMIDGIATAAGLQMVASCDLAFASPNARFCLPGVTNGGFCTTPAVAVSRSIGHKPLMDLLLSGTPKDSDWALQVGLITKIIDADDLTQTTMDFAKTLAQTNQEPLRAGLAGVRAQADMTLEQAYAHATPVMVSHFLDPGRLKREKQSKFSAS